MATDVECADALIRRARALLTGDGLIALRGIENGDERWTGPVLRAAAMLAAAGAAILVDACGEDESLPSPPSEGAGE